jgi:hypothetical protein
MALPQELVDIILDIIRDDIASLLFSRRAYICYLSQEAHIQEN